MSADEGFALERRLHAVREDLVDAKLRGQFSSASGIKFVSGREVRLGVPRAYLRHSPEGGSRIDTELLFGAELLCFERGARWSWVQARADGYVGYVETRGLVAAEEGIGVANKVVSVPLCPLYGRGEVKSEAMLVLPMGSMLCAEKEGGEDFLLVRVGRSKAFVHRRHVLDREHLVDWRGEDFVDTALKFLDAPYLWGGSSAWGIDCSALLQVALGMHGVSCPRDTDLQQKLLGQRLGEEEKLRRGDFVFWHRHVGIMLDGERMLHANAHHMRVAYESLSGARARIMGVEGEVREVRRLGEGGGISRR